MSDNVKIQGLKTIQLTSLKYDLKDAVINKKTVNVNVDSIEPQEILKGTYIANTLNKQGYECIAKIVNNKIDWECIPPV